MKRKIGEIELGNMAFLTDPCYGTKCRGNTTINTLEGRYNAYVTYTERNTFYSEKRISSILVVHKDFSSKYKKMPKDEREMLICAVDSGTCGIFNYDYYKKYHTEEEVNDEWYEENVIKMEKFIITDEFGCISQSGYGDGCYPVYAEYKGKNAFAIRIKFI